MATGNRLQPGEFLSPGAHLESPDGRFKFYFQGDANLVLYGWSLEDTSRYKVLYPSNTVGRGSLPNGHVSSGARAEMRQDVGKFYVSDGDKYIFDWPPVWGRVNSGSYLSLENDGALFIREPSGNKVYLHHSVSDTRLYIEPSIQIGDVSFGSLAIENAGGTDHVIENGATNRVAVRALDGGQYVKLEPGETVGALRTAQKILTLNVSIVDFDGTPPRSGDARPIPPETKTITILDNMALRLS